jgi:acetolactate synthase I/II/III large subunit
VTGGKALIRALEAHGVDLMFGYPGGAIMPVYDALIESSIRHILTRHEQGAAFGALGYSRASGKVGVCMATSGPGATNLVTGIADAFLDSVPLIVITGQVPTALMGTDAFQEVDVFGLTMPIVKHSFLVRRAADVSPTVHEAFRIAASGRPGPVWIDLPKDVAAGSCEYFTDGPISLPAPARAEQSCIDQASALIAGASRPIAYCGGGVVNAEAVNEFREFVTRTGIPTVQTLKGIGSLPAGHELLLGMLGMHGLEGANIAVQKSDLLIAVGARFDDRVTGKLAEFAPGAKVIHCDIDPAECGKLRRPDVTIVGELRQTLSALTVDRRGETADWRARCAALSQKHAWNYDAPTRLIYAPRFIRDLSKAADENVYITCDVGQHQMWVAQHYGFLDPRHHLTSGSLGAMGFGLPAAIGAQLARPDATVICVSGDGSIMMNIQELATIGRYKLPVKILLFDNQALGMVRQWQELFFNERYSEIDLSDNPDFVRVAEAFGVPGMRVERQEEAPNAIRRLLEQPGPLFCHVPIDPRANVWPLVPPLQSNTNMMIGSHA